MRVSVLIAAWNAERWLSEALASVVSQTAPAAEVIVIDDGSTDGTISVAERFQEVRVIARSTSGGPAAALNDGFNVAEGEAIAFLDADDIWPADNLERHGSLSELEASVGRVEEFLCPLEAGGPAGVVARPVHEGWLSGATVARREVFERAGTFDEGVRNGFWIDWVDRARMTGVRFTRADHLALRRRIRLGSLSTRSAERDRDLLMVARRALARRRAGGF